MCTKNYVCMVYSSRDMVCNRGMDRQTNRKSGPHLKTTNVEIVHDTFCLMVLEKLFEDL